MDETPDGGMSRRVALALLAATAAGMIYLAGEWAANALGVRAAPISSVDRLRIAIPLVLWPTLGVALFWALGRGLLLISTQRLLLAAWLAAAPAGLAALGGLSDPAVVLGIVLAAALPFVSRAIDRTPLPWLGLALILAPFLPAPCGVVLGAWLAWRTATRPELQDDGGARAGRRGLVWTFMTAAVASRLAFWWVTDRVWEDGLITLRHAENAVQGFGLTHHPAHGRVHGFTSAANVLIPLAGEALRPGAGLTALRLTAVAASAATIWIAGRLGGALRLSTPALTFWLAYLALEHSQVSFGIAGMETQIWTVVFLWGAWAHVSCGPFGLGLACGAAAYCRPDAGLWVALLLGARACTSVRQAAIATIAATAVAAPWLAWTTAYYGSPIPNTIRAKACYKADARPSEASSSGLLYVGHKVYDDWSAMASSLTPNFRGHGTEPTPIVPRSENVASLLMFLGAAGAAGLSFGTMWVVPVYLAIYAAYLLALVGWIFAWYIVPPAAFAALLVAVGIDRIITAANGSWTGRVQWLAAALLIAVYAAPLPLTFLAERQIQRLIEGRVRTQVGSWLKEHARPSDYVTAECLGYFGYYSDLPFHDYPGLSSPRAVAALSADPEGRYFAPIVERLRPEWVVIREHESPAAYPDHREVHRIELTQLERRELLRYLRFPLSDAGFIILHRRDLTLRDKGD